MERAEGMGTRRGRRRERAEWCLKWVAIALVVGFVGWAVHAVAKTMMARGADAEVAVLWVASGLYGLMVVAVLGERWLGPGRAAVGARRWSRRWEMALIGGASIAVAILGMGLSSVGAAVARSGEIGGVSRAADGGVRLSGIKVQDADKVIVMGMAGEFERILDDAIRDAKGGPVTIWLDSIGGSTSEGNAMADIVSDRARGTHIIAMVGGGALCHSACMSVFLAAEDRRVHPFASLMIHRADTARGLFVPGGAGWEHWLATEMTPYVRLQEWAFPFMDGPVRRRSERLYRDLVDGGVLAAPWHTRRLEFWCPGHDLAARYPEVARAVACEGGATCGIPVDAVERCRVTGPGGVELAPAIAKERGRSALRAEGHRAKMDFQRTGRWDERK